MIKQIRLISLAMALGYVICIGFFVLPQNFQTTLFDLTTIAILLYIINLQEIKISKKTITIAVLSAILAIYMSITTNTLMRYVNNLCLLATMGYLWFLHATKKEPNNGVLGFIGELFTTYLGIIPSRILSAKNLGLYFSEIKDFKNFHLPRINKNMFVGLIVAMPLILIFHSLFANVNEQYADFMSNIFVYVERFLTWLRDIEIINVILETLITGYIFFALLIPSQGTHVSTEANNNSNGTDIETILKTILTLVITLFAVFSFFQTTEALSKIQWTDFVKLSTYTQKGFWDLLIAAGLAYILSLYIIKISINKTPGLINLIMLFIAEISLLGIFNLHKLTILQWVFGFKDQRILATIATLLVILGITVFVLELKQLITTGNALYIQFLSLLVVVTFLNIINIDLFLTKHNPVSFYINGKKVKGYGYLLQNSYDNYKEWGNVMEEIKSTPLVKVDPTNRDKYTSYESICGNTYLSRGSFRNETKLETIHKNLIDKYENETAHQILQRTLNRYPYKTKSAGAFDKLRSDLRINFTEYQTYLWIKDNTTYINEFYSYLETECAAVNAT